MNRVNCPICSAPAQLEHEMPDVFLFSCDDCSHRFSIIKENHEEEYDKDYYLNKHRNWFENPDFELYEKVALHISEASSNTILDVGCGNANLLRFLHAKDPNLDLTGIDLSSVKGFENVKIINQSFLDHNWTSKYDMIASLATIEHITEIDKFVDKVYEKLNSNGLFFVMTMNDDSILYKTARLLRKLGFPKPFNRLYDKHHVNHFSHQSLKKLLISKGFKIKTIYLHNVPLKSLDIEHSNFLEYHINKISVSILFLLGLLSGKTYLQSIVAQRA
tara:strand:+ start:22570 stop:23394 length:825 start_codon:yes stop_codon:yes gene_type:complete